MFKTNPVLLKKLLDDVEVGKIQLPDFQRGWVWDDDRIRGLLASISRGFPVGAIMTLEAGGAIRLKSRLVEGVPDEAKEGDAEELLLDGQQRLTSLYQALKHEGPVHTHDSRGAVISRWYYIDMLKILQPGGEREDAIVSVPENRKVTQDFGRKTIQDLSTCERAFAEHMISTEALLEPTDWLLGYVTYWQAQSHLHPCGNALDFFNKFKREVLNTFSAYTLPIIQLDKNTPKEAVCTVFEKVNTGGVTLSVFELATAAFAADSMFSLRKDWGERRDRLHGQFGVLQGVEGEQFLQAITLLETQRKRCQAEMDGHPASQLPAIGCRKREILDLDLCSYQSWARQVEWGFEEAARFLRSHFIFTARDVPYVSQLIPLAVIFVELGETLSARYRDKVSQWFWSGIFGERYGGSATETQFALDLVHVPAWLRGGEMPTLVLEANFIPERLLSLRTRNSAAYKGLYALQMASGAADWRTAEQLSWQTWDDARVDIHHVFPKAWCQKTNPAVPPRLYNSIINKTPIDAQTNRQIGGRAPSAYLHRLATDMSPAALQEVLRAHWINPRHLEADQFSEFFVERGARMLDLIGQAMGKDLGDGRGVFTEALSSAELHKKFEDPEFEYDPVGDLAYGNQ